MGCKYEVGQHLRLFYAERPGGKVSLCNATIVSMRHDPKRRNSTVHLIHLWTPSGDLLERHDDTASITRMLRRTRSKGGF
jgi:hypothetical protein